MEHKITVDRGSGGVYPGHYRVRCACGWEDTINTGLGDANVLGRRHLREVGVSPPLGRVQLQVLWALDDSSHFADPTIRDIAADFPGLTLSGVRSAISALEGRKLVKAAGWSTTNYGREARTYALTEAGRELLAQLDRPDDEEED